MLTFIGNVRRKGLYVLGGSFAFGACIVGFSLSRNLPLSLVMLFGIGFSIVCSISIASPGELALIETSPTRREDRSAARGKRHW